MEEVWDKYPSFPACLSFMVHSICSCAMLYCIALDSTPYHLLRFSLVMRVHSIFFASTYRLADMNSKFDPQRVPDNSLHRLAFCTAQYFVAVLLCLQQVSYYICIRSQNESSYISNTICMPAASMWTDNNRGIR